MRIPWEKSHSLELNQKKQQFVETPIAVSSNSALSCGFSHRQRGRSNGGMDEPLLVSLHRACVDMHKRWALNGKEWKKKGIPLALSLSHHNVLHISRAFIMGNRKSKMCLKKNYFKCFIFEMCFYSVCEKAIIKCYC